MSPKDKKQKMIDYARELFCTVDKDGNQVFSFADIAIKISQKFNKKYTRETICSWSKKYDFSNVLNKIKHESIKKATDTLDATLDEIIEKQSTILAADFKAADNLAKIGYKVFFDLFGGKEHEYIDEKTALQAIKQGIDTKHRIMQIPTVVNSNVNVTTDLSTLSTEELILRAKSVKAIKKNESLK